TTPSGPTVKLVTLSSTQSGRAGPAEYAYYTFLRATIRLRGPGLLPLHAGGRAGSPDRPEPPHAPPRVRGAGDGQDDLDFTPPRRLRQPGGRRRPGAGPDEWRRAGRLRRRPGSVPRAGPVEGERGRGDLVAACAGGEP